MKLFFNCKQEGELTKLSIGYDFHNQVQPKNQCLSPSRKNEITYLHHKLVHDLIYLLIP